MSFTVTAFRQTAQNNAGLTQVTPIADRGQRTSGNFLLVPRQMNKLCGIYVGGSTMNRARFVAPSLGNFSNYEVEPIDQVVSPSALPPYNPHWSAPIEFIPTEFFSIEATESGAGDVHAIQWWCDAAPAPVTGEIVTLRATSATALVANTWSNVALTFSSTLPGGRFQIVGARVECAGAIAFRFVPVGTSTGFTPGGLAFSTAAKTDWPIFRRGGLGVWIEFDNDTPPTVDILSLSADATQTVWLDLIYLGAGPTAG